jgi:hypothetical protein
VGKKVPDPETRQYLDIEEEIAAGLENGIDE